MNDIDERIDVDETISNYGYMNFKSIKDEWSIYRLSDETILKIKAIPLKFLILDNNYPMSSTVAMTTFSPSGLKGEPSISPLPTTEADMAKELKEIDMDFKPLDEPWNEYRLDNGITVFVRTVATSISSSKLRDLVGEPLYLVSHQVQTKRHPPI